MDKRFPALCEKTDCTACGACQQVCQHGALDMASDEKGFLYPQVDMGKCVQCLACERVCPMLKDMRPVHELPRIYACWHKSHEVRMKSSSGGAFSAIAEFVLERGGCVWGAAYAENLELTYQCVGSVADLDRLRRSKYVQCRVGDAFCQVKEQLKSGKTVLFVGTSCHLRGLYAFIPTALHERLITADFICHGVPSPKVFRMYVNWIEKRYGDRLADFNFRDKRYGWDNGILTVGTFSRIGERTFMNKENSYFQGMLHDLFIRPCCHRCTSNGLQRESDFTVADFWGIGRNERFSYEREKHFGVSLLALNSEKASRMFSDGVKNKMHCVPRSLEEAYVNNWNYRYSARINPKSETFWKAFGKAGTWDDLSSFFRLTISERCKLFVKKYMGPVVSNKLRRMIGK